MEWLWSLVTALVGWWLGHRQSMQDRKRGVEEGAQAAFSIELALVSAIMERDRLRLKVAFEAVDLGDTKRVRDVAQLAGEIYAEIIRRDAFDDARVSNFSQHDRESWQRAFDQEMPPVGYKQGYLQAIKDVITGTEEYAQKYFEEAVAKALVARIDQSQRKFSGPPGGFYLESYDPNGKVLGAELLVEVVVRTFDRAEKERGAISASAADPRFGSGD